MATRRGGGRPAKQIPAAGAVRFSLSTHSPAQAAATHALSVLGTKTPVKSKTPRAQQPQLPAPRAVALAEGSAQGKGSVGSKPHTQPSTSLASKSAPLPEIHRQGRAISSTSAK